jgi:DNA-binding PadR family transcriptional regulator
LSHLPELDPLVHSQFRLAVLSILSGADVVGFTYLRERLQTTDGNLSVHLSKLEKAGYVSVQKQFVERRPVTHYRITERGRKALLHYVQDLKSLLELAQGKGIGSVGKKKERK